MLDDKQIASLKIPVAVIAIAFIPIGIAANSVPCLFFGFGVCVLWLAIFVKDRKIPKPKHERGFNGMMIYLNQQGFLRRSILIIGCYFLFVVVEGDHRGADVIVVISLNIVWIICFSIWISAYIFSKRNPIKIIEENSDHGSARWSQVTNMDERKPEDDAIRIYPKKRDYI